MHPLFLFAVLAAPQDALEAKVTFEGRAARVENMLPELSKKAGLPLMFSPQTKDEVLILRMKDVPLKEAMEKIAFVAAAEWQPEGAGFRLVRSAALQKKLAANHVALAKERLDGSLASLEKALQASGKLSDSSAKVLAARMEAQLKSASEREEEDIGPSQNLTRSFPCWRLGARLLLTVDRGRLASAEDGGRVTFSTSPNRSQIPFGKGQAEAVSAYLTERSLLAKHLPKDPKMPNGGVETSLWSAMNLAKNVGFAPDKVVLDVFKGSVSSYQVNVYVANRKGKVLDRSYFSLDPYSFLEPSVPPQTAPSPAPPSQETLIVFSKLTEECRRLRGAGPDAGKEPSPELRSFLLNPDKHELGELMLSEQLLALAKAKNSSLAANLTDSILQFGIEAAIAKNSTIEGVEKILRSWSRGTSNTIPEFEDAWITLRPRDPHAISEKRTNRFALREYLQAALARDLTLDDKAAYAAANRTQDCMQMAFAYLVFFPAYRMSYRDSQNWHLLKFHGTLTPFQKNAMSRNDVIRFFELPPACKTLAEKMFLGEYVLMRQFQPKGPPLRTREEDDPDDDFSSLKALVITERFPNGIPPDLPVRIDRSQSQTVLAQNTEGRMVRSMMEYNGASGLAMSLFVAERPDLFPGRSRPGANNSFQIFDKDVVRYTFQADEENFFVGTLESRKPVSKEFASLDQLPPEYLKQVQAELAKIREQYKNRPPGGGGS